MIKLPSTSVEAHGKASLGADVTVAMSAYGNHAATVSALQSLFLSAEGDFELMLIDNDSPDAEVKALLRQAKAEHTDTTLFVFPENREYTGAVNAILSHAKGRWVLFLSNDIFVTPYYLREIMAAACADERNGIVRGCSNFVDNGKPTHNVRLARPPASYEELFAIGRQVAEQMPGELLVDEFLTGDAFLVSRAVLDRIGTFDPVFYGYFADHDLGIRAQIAGFRLILAQRAFAYHQQAANFNYLPQPLQEKKLAERWGLVERNWHHFKAKYGMPAELPYTSIQHVPWKALASQPFDPSRHFVKPGDYLADHVA